jgi:membrane fusion protein, multidrug efflux system
MIPIRYTFALACIAFSLLGCGGKKAPPPMMAMPVKVQTVEATKLEEKMEFVGSVLANEVVDVQSEAEGTIKEILFEEGQSVERRDLLLELDPEKLSASLAEAEASRDLNKGNFERSKSLLESRSISQQEFDQARSNFESANAAYKRAKKNLEDSRITAPFAGILGPRKVSPGQVISRGTILTSIVNIDPAKVEFSIPERYISRVKVDQSFELQVDAFPEVLHGKVYFVSPQIDEQTRTILVKGSVPNSEKKLRPGMLGRVNLIVDVKPQALLISETALIYRGDSVSVFIMDAQEIAQPKMVKVGLRLKGQVEISEGLHAGDRVITEGHQKLGPGSKVVIKQDAPASEKQEKSQ